ncbi:MAG: D-Ala-D-Ala carboxypeptidase family metallohydrolase [Gammaproteobacteria bacterium]|nr:D-Ala-D-Ala carboxypeptidase family metallohydrolase [Gammaproteobacteria bacterium]
MRAILGIAFLICVAQQSAGQPAFDAGRSDFAIGLNNEIYPYREFAAFVLPGERVVIRLLDAGENTFELSAGSGSVERTDLRRFVWVAPQTSGLVELSAVRSDGESIRINAFVQVPARRVRGGFLNGYEIGQCPRPLSNDPVHATPRGFIEVNERDLAVPVSPHFVLGQFVSDRSAVFPKYIVLRERLVLKLEILLERVNLRIRADSFGILSAYRTPASNQTIGGSLHSRHIYGGAAAIIVDREPADGLIDDLDGNGQIGRGDAVVLFTIAEALFREPDQRHLQGGLAPYGRTETRGPYLHVDARGYRARWNSDLDVQRFQAPREPRHRRDFPLR